MTDVTPPPDAAKPGTVTSRVHPGDPLKVLTVVGFESLEDALGYLKHGFVDDTQQLRVKASLGRGDTVSFDKASYLAVYAPNEAGKMVLLSLLRCHADLALTLGSCGYQLQVGVELPAAAGEVPAEAAAPPGPDESRLP